MDTYLNKEERVKTSSNIYWNSDLVVTSTFWREW